MSLLCIYWYVPLRICVTVQGRVWLHACGLTWVEQAGCAQPLRLLMLFQARLNIARLPLPTETEVLPWAFTPPDSPSWPWVASHEAGRCLYPLPPIDLQSSFGGVGIQGVSRNPTFIAPSPPNTARGPCFSALTLPPPTMAPKPMEQLWLPNLWLQSRNNLEILGSFVNLPPSHRTSEPG